MTVFFVLNGNAEVGGSGRLFTSQILARTHWRLWPLEEQWSQQNYGNPPNPAYEAHMWHYDSFMRIGQMFWSWLFGLLGGVLARWFYLRGRRQRELDPGRGVN